MSGAFTVIFTLNLQYFSWGCSGSLSISKQKWAKLSSRNEGLDEIRGGQALLSITARRTPWPCQLRKDLILRDAAGGWICRTHPASSPTAAFTPGTLCLFPLAGSRICTNLLVIFFWSGTNEHCSSIARGLPKVSGRGTGAATFPAEPGRKLREGTGRRWLCRAGSSFARQAVALPKSRFHRWFWV